MHRYTILVDSREKRPLPFPATIPLLSPGRLPLQVSMVTAHLTTRVATLETGDYLLEGHEGVTLLERKGSLHEIANNCLTAEGRRKFVNCCTRLRSACLRPLLMLETSLSDLRLPTENHPAGAGFDALQRLSFEYGCHLMLVPHLTAANRLWTGEFVARTLINSSIIRPAPCPSTLTASHPPPVNPAASV